METCWLPPCQTRVCPFLLSCPCYRVQVRCLLAMLNPLLPLTASNLYLSIFSPISSAQTCLRLCPVSSVPWSPAPHPIPCIVKLPLSNGTFTIVTVASHLSSCQRECRVSLLIFTPGLAEAGSMADQAMGSVLWQGAFLSLCLFLLLFLVLRHRRSLFTQALGW